MYFFSRNLNENLIFRDENGNSFLSISCFETRTRNRKWFLKVEREKIKLILTGIPGNGNSRHSLLLRNAKKRLISLSSHIISLAIVDSLVLLSNVKNVELRHLQVLTKFNKVKHIWANILHMNINIWIANLCHSQHNRYKFSTFVSGSL